MPTIKFTVPTEPVPFKRTLKNGKRHFNDPRYSGFKEEVGFWAKIAMDANGRATFDGAIRLHVDVFTKYKPTSLRAGDIDNHLKAVLDALNGICFVDDRQIVEGHVYLFKGEPHIEIELEAIE